MHFDVVHHLTVSVCSIQHSFSPFLSPSNPINGIHKWGEILPVFLVRTKVLVLLLLLRSNDYFIVLVAAGAFFCVSDAHIEDAVAMGNSETVASGISTFSICGLVAGRLLLHWSNSWLLLLLLLLLL